MNGGKRKGEGGRNTKTLKQTKRNSNSILFYAFCMLRSTANTHEINSQREQTDRCIPRGIKTLVDICVVQYNRCVSVTLGVAHWSAFT